MQAFDPKNLRIQAFETVILKSLDTPVLRVRADEGDYITINVHDSEDNRVVNVRLTCAEETMLMVFGDDYGIVDLEEVI